MNENITPGYALDIIDANHKQEKRRLWTLIFVLVALLFGSNLAWIIRECTYENITMEQTVSSRDSSGIAVTGTGDLEYGNVHTSDD